MGDTLEPLELYVSIAWPGARVYLPMQRLRVAPEAIEVGHISGEVVQYRREDIRSITPINEILAGPHYGLRIESGPSTELPSITLVNLKDTYSGLVDRLTVYGYPVVPGDPPLPEWVRITVVLLAFSPLVAIGLLLWSLGGGR